MSEPRRTDLHQAWFQADCPISRRSALIGGAAGFLASASLARVDVGAALSAGEGAIQVPIARRSMTAADLKTEIVSEGSVVIGSAYPAGQDAVAAAFARHIQATYSVQIGVTFSPIGVGAEALGPVYDAVESGATAPFDVLATRKDHWFSAKIHAQASGVPVMEEFLPSDLIPNEARLFGLMKSETTAVGFQSAAVPTVVFNADTVDYLKDWTDLADERMKGRLLLWAPGDEISDGMLLSMTGALKMDYRNPDHVTAAIKYMVEKIHPNALKYTTDLNEVKSLITAGTVDAVVYWSSLARDLYSGGMTSARALIPTRGQYPFYGVLWIPAGVQHPVLAQLFIDWRISVDAQMPNLIGWGIDPATWLNLHEGLIRRDYADAIPLWLKDAYSSFYPTADRISKEYWDLDWEYYLANAPAWREEWTAALNR
jgi:ABC-type Fe3+ transport system substrate-binding protein